jgi:hypothetical protein
MARKKTKRIEQDADTVIRRYEERGDTPASDVLAEFNEAGQEGAGSQLLRRKLRAAGPDRVEVTGGDLDASWDRDGEETVGGDNPTPDQDIVEEIGKAAGVTFEDNEPIKVDKLEQRDAARWELDPASSEDYQERQKLK